MPLSGAPPSGHFEVVESGHFLCVSGRSVLWQPAAKRFGPVKVILLGALVSRVSSVSVCYKQISFNAINKHSYAITFPTQSSSVAHISRYVSNGLPRLCVHVCQSYYELYLNDNMWVRVVVVEVFKKTFTF